MMTSKTAQNVDTQKRESFLMECVIKPMVKKLSGYLITALVVVALITYVGKQIPTLFPQHVTFSEEIIEEKLQALGELVTAEKTRHGTQTWGASREFLGTGINLPGTYNELTLDYFSTIKVGYDFSKIKAKKVDDSTVQVTLPKVQVLGNFLEASESTILSPFNRIPDGKADELKARAKSEALKAAENEGIYQLAEEEAKKQISNLLSELGDFTIIFK